MRFVVRMVGRELRASWRRLAFFFVCVAVGVSAVVALRSLIQQVGVAMSGETRALLAADVLLESEQPWSEAARTTIDGLLAAEPGLLRTSSVEMVTMARSADETGGAARVVELRGVEAAFPFYGAFVLQGGSAYRHGLLADGGALVRPELLTQLDVAVGDDILVGEGRFEVRGVILREPGGRIGAFSFGPRVLVDYDDLLETGLLAVGARAERQILIKVPEPRVDPLAAALREPLRDEFVRVRTYRNTEDRLARNLSRAEDYLSLIGFVVLVLGGIGVWSVTRVFVQQRLHSVAVLKCLGATGGRVLAVYVTQVALLGASGSLLGVALARLALAAVPERLAAQAATAAGLTSVATDLTGSAMAQGVAVGLLVSLLFALAPLLEVRHAKPLLLLRRDAVRPAAGIDWPRAAAIGLAGAGLIAVAVWQAASLEVGLYVSGGFAAVAAALHLIGRGLVRAAAPLERAPWFALRHAALSLSRPGNQTRVILLAVGLGSFFIIGVRAMQTNLLGNFDRELRDDAPDMFLIDIQQDQAAGVRAVLAAAAGEGPQLIPVLRARITGVAGRRVSFDSPSGARRAGLGREYTVTYRASLAENERVVAGRFWDDVPAAEPEISIEENLRDEQGLELGDTVRFDVLGRQIAARVTSVREVRWDDTRSGGFMFLFRPGSFGDAPHTYIAFLQGPAGGAARARLQRDVVARYPNVSVIDGLAVLDTLRRVLDYVTLAISVVGGVALFSGGLILVGAVAMTRFQRIHEAAIFRTLGANARLLALMLVLEYGVLGILAGGVGSLGALILTWALARHVFEIAWFPSLLANVSGVFVTAAVVGCVGVAASVDVLRRKPLATLRAE